MVMKSKFLLLILLCWPLVSMAEDATISTAINKYKNDVNAIPTANVTGTTVEEAKKEMEKHIATAQNAECDPNTKDNKAGETTLSDEEKAKREAALKEKEDAYKVAKENEQSLENRTLTAVTTAATGIGGMELAQGLAEQTADKNAASSMDAYIATFRCTYGNGKQVKAGPEEIELPGGNDQNMMNLRAQYIALADDLKERKAALDMAPGIESEEILDKSQMGLYDDENIGITGGAYESLYRAKMLNSETDQTKIDEMADVSKKRVIAGGVLVGAGTLIGVGGNLLLNDDEIKDKIKELKEKRDDKKEAKALEKLKDCLKKGGATDTESLSFSTFKPSILNLNRIKCDSPEWKKAVEGKDATTLFVDNDDIDSYKTSFSNFVYTEDDNTVKTDIADNLFKSIKK